MHFKRSKKIGMLFQWLLILSIATLWGFHAYEKWMFHKNWQFSELAESKDEFIAETYVAQETIDLTANSHLLFGQAKVLLEETPEVVVQEHTPESDQYSLKSVFLHTENPEQSSACFSVKHQDECLAVGEKLASGIQLHRVEAGWIALSTGQNGFKVRFAEEHNKLLIKVKSVTSQRNENGYDVGVGLESRLQKLKSFHKF